MGIDKIDVPGFLDGLLTQAISGLINVYTNGTLLANRIALDVKGPLVAADNGVTERTEISIPAATTTVDGYMTHQQVIAVGGLAGLTNGVVKAVSGALSSSPLLVADIDAAARATAATASTIAVRGASGECAFAALTCTTLTVSASISTPSLTVSGLGAGIVHSSSGGALTSSAIVDADVSASAAIAGSKLQAASGSNAGSFASADYTSLHAATSSATSGALCQRDGGGGCTFVSLNTGSIAVTFAATCATLVASSSVTAPLLQSKAPPTGTGATAGTALVVEAQDGQNVASGTNNNGANLTLAASKAGAGGTGGSPGYVTIGIGQSSFTELFRVQQAGTGVSLGMLTQAAAAGGNTWLYAQRGATGQRGGQIFIGGGEDGTAGTGTDGGNGGIFLDTGSPGSSTAAKIMMGFSGTTSFMDFYVDTSSNSNINTGARNFRILTSGNFVCSPGGQANFLATGQVFIAGSKSTIGGASVDFSDPSTSVIYSTMTNGAAWLWQWSNSVTTSVTIDAGPTTANTAGKPLVAKGGSGGTVASGTNKNGGACRNVGGAIGTGGSGGLAGDATLEHPVYGAMAAACEPASGQRALMLCSGSATAAATAAATVGDGYIVIAPCTTNFPKTSTSTNAKLSSSGAVGLSVDSAGSGQLIAAGIFGIQAITSNATASTLGPSTATKNLDDLAQGTVTQSGGSASPIFNIDLTKLSAVAALFGVIDFDFTVRCYTGSQCGVWKVSAAVSITGTGTLSTQFSVAAITLGTAADGGAYTPTFTHAINASGIYTLSATPSKSMGQVKTKVAISANSN